MADRAITALDYAKREKAKDTRDRIRKLAARHGLRLDEHTAGKPVQAIIDYGRWIALCECGGAEAVDPKDQVFFCVSCGNDRTSGKLRKVNFPADYKTIEAEVMARPLKKRGAGDAIEQQRLCKPKGKPRNWSPG